MYRGLFKFGSEMIEVIVRGNELLFSDVSSGIISTIDGLKINKSGVLKEHPDLKDDEEWRKKAIARLKEHVRKMETEEQKIDYVKDELVKFGWEAKHKQRAGHRPKKWN